MEIEIETKQLKSNRLFSAYLVYPTRGMEISFRYEGADIKNVRDIGFFAGKHPYPEVTREEGKSVTLKLGNRGLDLPDKRRDVHLGSLADRSGLRRRGINVRHEI